jgi:ribosome-binding factor A
MTSSIRLKRLSKLALQVASQVVLYELHDPRLEMVTLTRVKLSSDLAHATIFWSVMGDDAHRNKVRHALDAAVGPVQRAIASNFETRRSPRVQFQHDESIEGAIRVGGILDELKREREEREGTADDESEGDEPTG